MNRGFTLVELLGVIIILLVIFMIVVPAVNKVISDSEDTIYDSQINRILTAAYDYSLKDLSLLPDKYQKNYVTLGELINSGYLDPIVDPKTDKFYPEDYLISIENVGSNYIVNDSYVKKNGDYIYKLEFVLMESQNYIDTTMNIDLIDNEGNNIETRVSEYGYASTIEKDAVFIDGKLKFDDGVNLSNIRQVRNIYFNDKLVDSVDTSKVGVYTINYVVLYNDNLNPHAYELSWEIAITE